MVLEGVCALLVGAICDANAGGCGATKAWTRFPLC